jgi:TusA-related sulfurtransferase
MADVHEFDAGDMSCGDGFAAEFRRRIEAIPVGDVLVATVRDPSAKTDLPPLARMMGHEVRGVSEEADGSLVFTVARGR